MKYIPAILFLFLGQQIKAQEFPSYYVFQYKGEANLAKPGVKPVAVRQGQYIFKKDTIILKKGAEVTLADKDAGFLLLNVARRYLYSDLVRMKSKKGNDNITAKYLQLLFHELIDPGPNFEKFKRQHIAGVSGGVSRGDDCRNRIFPVNGLQTSATAIVFKWHKTSPSSNYTLSFYDSDKKDLANINVKDTVQAVNLTEILKRNTGKYFWQVASEDGICEDEIPFFFDLMTAADEKKQAEQLLTSGGESIEVRLQQIDKLEKNAFINIAAARYATLVKDNPGNKPLLKSYVVFLLKYGFEEEAKAAW
ncbi:MAG: hypothetical protein ACHQFX_11875, partial [Chitinophagales bacterium]